MARKSFGPVVLLGLAGSGLAAVAGNKPWAEPVVPPGMDDAALTLVRVAGTPPGDVPLGGALALVVLACWGVLLVTRGRVRRGVAVAAAVAAAGVLAVVADAVVSLPEEVVAAAARLGAPGLDAEWTLWPWAAALGALVALLAAVAAVVLAPGWPEMGKRYDAPTGAAGATRGAAAGAAAAPGDQTEHQPEDRGNLELWKALDAGEDPTE
jgi:uncharacterized membrane protein (TIGR02234 family)